MKKIQKTFYLLKKGIYRIITGKSIEKEYKDIAIEWINYSHASPENGMPYKNQFLFKEAMEILTKNKLTDPIVEIGTFCGRSTTSIMYMMDKFGLVNKIITTDPFKFSVNDKALLGLGKKMDDYELYIKNQFITNMKFWNKKFDLFSFDLDSDSFFNSWELKENKRCLFNNYINLGGPVSFCFIDGDHSYAQAYKDFINVDKYLINSGVIIFDDSGKYHSDAIGDNGVYKVVHDLIKTGRYKVLYENPNIMVQKIS